jgi:hypothetical protein
MTSTSTIDEQRLYNRWCDQYHEAAVAEGWTVFECDGSQYGRWQVQRDDETDAIESAEHAWKMILEQDTPLHRATIDLILQINPGEFSWWVHGARDIGLDMKKVRPDLIPTIVAAVLTA